MTEKTTTPASFEEKLLLQKGEKQKLFNCQNGARNPMKQFNGELQTCYQQLAQNTISPASFPEAPLLQKGEKQKVFHCQK